MGDIHPTSGDCLLHEKHIRKQAREHPGTIDYCPQFDVVDRYLTSRKALMCYAKSIGITDRGHVMNLTLRKFHMESFANRVLRTYSGGMRSYFFNFFIRFFCRYSALPFCRTPTKPSSTAALTFSRIIIDSFNSSRTDVTCFVSPRANILCCISSRADVLSCISPGADDSC
ncbi:unnamed protein product [Rotaria sp. Silwood2]|nr:unnamed protein product [Rotaria sp. Silwood2]